MVETKKFDTSKPHLNIVVIGHVDHGKSTLTAKIVGKSYQQIDDVQGSKSSGSKQRGKTINATHEEFESKERHYALIDCPGHEDYIKNMITGTAQGDGAILVVSAVEGSQIQTQKHIDLAKQIGVKHLIVFINKIDTVPDLEQRELVKEEVKEELRKRGYDPEKIPIISGSALCALEGREPEIGEKSVLKLIEALDKHIPIPERDENKPFLMWIESKYGVKVGTVVTGKVERGKVKMGDEVEIVGLGQRKKAKVKGIQSFRKDKDIAAPGDDVGICLSGIKFEEVERGQVLAAPGTVTSHTKIFASAYIFKAEERGRRTVFGNGFRPQFFFGTADVTGTIKLAPDKVVGPGEAVEFEVDLGGNDVVIEKNSNFIIWEGNTNVGGGVVTKIIE
ncbi:MAG: GTP-binding protein [Candidatus Moeniiplasma glomeromycotorum]|nr:GTP-binding protein [Candidatus Moeniiplasma glomeromycotorum]MCE8167168.1 GTP-binding protein [Candidatus Moeniiplasma glomeromycotorum]MCE8168820.1 GTP-binding protein [Candidatus Moeniiplasma glomeromycotorum]